MFHAAANRKHSYLHKWLKCKEPGVTNAYMDQGKAIHFDLHIKTLLIYIYCAVMRMSDLEEPIQPLLKTLASMQPQSYGLVMDQTKGQLAYGHWGVPQLVYTEYTYIHNEFGILNLNILLAICRYTNLRRKTTLFDTNR